jgi:hypothetical protein
MFIEMLIDLESGRLRQIAEWSRQMSYQRFGEETGSLNE